MDNGFDLSSLISGDGMGDVISNAMSTLMKRPDLVQTLASELGLSSAFSGEDPPAKENSTVKEDVAAEQVSAKPEEKKDEGGSRETFAHSSHKNSGGRSDKERLLLALRPYMSPRRQEAIDMMVQIDAIGSLLGGISPDLLKGLLGGDRFETNKK